MLEHTRLGAHEITLPTSTMSDWRLVLQDSITSKELRSGCISLLDQIDTDLPLSETEMKHVVRFLEYSSIHVEYRGYPYNQLLETILSEDMYFHTNHTSALIKLVCHPSETLQTAALSFLDASIWNSFPRDVHFAAAVTRLLPRLLERLKPHEIPLNGMTIKFHRHLISILDTFFSVSSPAEVRHCLENGGYASPAEIHQSLRLEAIFNPSFVYLRSLIAHPVSPTDTHSGFMLLSTMRQFIEIVLYSNPHTIFPEVQHFFGEIRKLIVEELAKQLDLSTADKAALCLRSDSSNPQKAELWLKGFEYLLDRVSERTQFSDLGMLAVALFLSNRPSDLRLFFNSDDEFGLKMNDTIISSTKFDTQSLWTLLSPTQPQHATTVLDAFNRFMNHQDSMTDEKHIWSSWFPSFVNAIDLSKLPFTADFIRFHKQLIGMLRNHFSKIRQSANPRKPEWKDELRGEVDDAYRAFYTHTKEYVVHLSLHPFALDNERSDRILDFLRKSYLRDFEDSLNKPYREDVKNAMDEVARTSASPPFILISELVCRLTDDEIIDIVDRIVALLKSESPLDDDTILRICAFHEHQLSHIYLPDLFRKAGRSTEQFFHAFECLLSLPIDHFDRSPINSLLTTQWIDKPTLDEWDDVDFERVGVVKRMISQNSLSVASKSKAFITLIVDYIIGRLPQIHHCAARLRQGPFNRLLAPSIDFLCQFFIHPPNSTFRESDQRMEQFVGVCKLCDQSVIAQCFSRTGFFSRFVTGLFDDNCRGTVSCFKTIINCESSPDISIEDIIAIQGRISNFVEEGLLDALEFLIMKQRFNSFTARDIASKMMKFCGANFKGLRG
ncbi:hypothetical protein BLNAU_18902 [Blattamonas nauphoetae]|uniref:Uncharacterized protein n=1 Tax=Blattamonas nauphoetae TaxID=2049346 RepID=A0ABQ9X3J9_9EUKA|nr:hypothetical protein BLNAU_18902 [Blattamonas nauphoetae]